MHEATVAILIISLVEIGIVISLSIHANQLTDLERKVENLAREREPWSVLNKERK